MILVRTLGGLAVRSENGATIGSIMAQPKRAAVLCYLAAARPLGAQQRDAIVAMFWPELDQEHARNALNQAVHFLRRSLGVDAILSPSAEELTLNRELIRCDADELERCFQREALEKGLSLYEGDFLNGFHVSDAPAFDQWVTNERSRLCALAARGASQLARQAHASGNPTSAIEWARRASMLAPYDEERARFALTLMHEAGQHALAIAFFESFARRLSDDLDLEPSAQTRALAAKIRSTAPIHGSSGVVTELKLTTPVSTQPTREDLEAQLRNELSPDLEIVRSLGRGSMAIAFLAREPALKRLVTVKVLRPQLAADRVARQRFEREAQSAARISHTNVASIHRIGSLRTTVPYMVVEYIDGRSLADTISARGLLPAEEARRLMIELASALAAAHDQGVIHRDVRPSNIFIEHRSGRLVLTDFGIAALMDSGREALVQLTPVGQRLGDPRYTSPEQTRGEPVTELSDIYSYGVVAYEFLTGSGLSDFPRPDASDSRRGGEPVNWEISVPAELRAIVQRCLVNDTTRRPRAHDILALLGAAV